MQPPRSAASAMAARTERVMGARLRPGRRRGRWRRRLAVIPMTPEVPAHQLEEDRHEEDGQHGGGEHAADHAGADVVLAARARAMAAPAGMTPAMKAMEVIRIGRRRSRAASMAASKAGLARLLRIHRELHDQDGVLGRQADGGQQADLEIDVVEQAAQGRPPAARRPRPAGSPASPTSGIAQLS